MAIARQNRRNLRNTIALLALAGTVALAGNSRAFVVANDPSVGTPGPGIGGNGLEPKFDLSNGDSPTLEAASINPIRLRFAVAGPNRWLCARRNGAVFAAKRCGAGEETLDPTALRLCRSSSGGLRLTGASCKKNESKVDMRKVRGVTPSAWRSHLASPAAAKNGGPAPGSFGLLADFSKQGTMGNDLFPSPTKEPTTGEKKPGLTRLEPALEVEPVEPDVTTLLQLRQGLCARKNGQASLHTFCPQGEKPIGPDGLRSCIKKSGALELRAKKCRKGSKVVDLREFRTPGAPVGIGPLVGILPRLADLASEYPNG